MAHPGQSSQGFRVGPSSLRILHVGHRTSMGSKVTEDAFTQTNPPVVGSNVTDQLPSNPKDGVLGGSVAITRPDAGNGLIGGPEQSESDPSGGDLRPLGLFIVDAQGQDFQNAPTEASGKGSYVSSQGTYGNALFESKNLNSGADLSYGAGDMLYCSRNGYLTKVADADNAMELAVGYSSATTMGVVKVAPDSEVDELVFDLRI